MATFLVIYVQCKFLCFVDLASEKCPNIFVGLNPLPHP